MTCDLRTWLAYANEYDFTPEARAAQSFVEHCQGLTRYVARRLAHDRGTPLEVEDCPACPPAGSPYTSELIADLLRHAEEIEG